MRTLFTVMFGVVLAAAPLASFANAPAKAKDEPKGKVVLIAGKTLCFGQVDKGTKCDMVMPPVVLDKTPGKK